MTRLLLFLLPLALSLRTDICRAQVPAEDRWIEARTEHFRLLSNASERTTFKIGAKLEQLRQLLAAAFGGDYGTALPTHIYIFKDEASIAPFKMTTEGKPDSIAGYYVGAPCAHYLAIDASAGEAPFRTVYHEFVHYFVQNNLPYIPLWLNEGLAEYFSTFRAKGTKVELGLPIEEHRYWIAQYGVIPMNELFLMDKSSSDYREGFRRGVFYAQSWALTHYLMVHPERRRLNTLLKELRRGATADDAFKAAYDMDLSSLDEELQAVYAHGRSANYLVWELDRDLEAGTPVVRPLKRADVLFHLGDLLAHRHPIQFDAAEKHLTAALAADSTRAETYACLGHLRHEQKRYPDAHAFYERAAAIAPDDYSIRFGCGWSLLEEYIDSNQRRPWSSESTPPLLLSAREHFRHCITIDSLSVEDELGFGRTFLLDRGQVFEGISALTHVVNQEPWRLDAVRDLVVLTAHSGGRQAARALLEKSLRPRGTTEDLHHAEMAIAVEDLRQAELMAKEERFAEAQDYITQTIAQTQDERVRGHVEAYLAQLERYSPESPSSKK